MVQQLRLFEARGNTREMNHKTEEKRRLNASLVRAAANEAKRTRRTFVFVVMYSRWDLTRTSWREPFLLRALSDTGFAVIDTKPILLEAARASGRPVQSYYGEDNHLSADGNEIVARAIRDRLAEIREVATPSHAGGKDD
jgi:hypothetical protein